MAQIIRLKRTSVAGSVPTTSDLSTGELAINVHDGKVFLRRSGSVDFHSLSGVCTCTYRPFT